MLDRHEQFSRDAAAEGAQVMCFQELFYGPYFGITQDKKYYRYAEPADGPIVQRFAALAKELGMVHILPIYEEEQTGVYYNTAVVVDADGIDPRPVPQGAHPARGEVLGEVLLPPRQPGLPGVGHRGRQGRRAHLLRPPLPRGLARARPQRRPHGLQPQRHQARPLQPAVGGRGPLRRRRQRLLRAPAQPGGPRGQRVRRRGGQLLRHQPGDRPARQLRRRARQRRQGGAAGARPRPRHGPADARRLAVLPRPPTGGLRRTTSRGGA